MSFVYVSILTVPLSYSLCIKGTCEICIIMCECAVMAFEKEIADELLLLLQSKATGLCLLRSGEGSEVS